MIEQKQNKTSLIVVIIIVISIPLVLGLAYRFRSELKIERRVMEIQNALSNENKIFVKMDLVAGVNDKDLRVIFNIPCKNMKMKQNILENMAVIRHEMLMSFDDDLIKESIEKRDFEKIKSNCLTILNKYAPVDVDKVYVDFFAHN